MLEAIKQWWKRVTIEQYELTVWFEDSCTTNHIKGVDINGCGVEIKTVKPFDYHIVKIY